MRKTTLRGVWLAAIWAGLIGVAVGLWLNLPAIYFMPVFLVMLAGVVFWEPRQGTIKCLRRLLGVKSQQNNDVV